MRRTQIYLHDDQHKTLTALVKKKNKPMGELIRDFIDNGLKEKNVDKSGKNAIQKLIDIAATKGPKDLSKNLDHYLYGASKKQ